MESLAGFFLRCLRAAFVPAIFAVARRGLLSTFDLMHPKPGGPFLLVAHQIVAFVLRVGYPDLCLRVRCQAPRRESLTPDRVANSRCRCMPAITAGFSCAVCIDPQPRLSLIYPPPAPPPRCRILSAGFICSAHNSNSNLAGVGWCRYHPAQANTPLLLGAAAVDCSRRSFHFVAHPVGRSRVAAHLGLFFAPEYNRGHRSCPTIQP